MGGGKETPRQKMIGMMYLVLTALLAMNVSKQILQGYLSVNESLEKTRDNLQTNNKLVTEAFRTTIEGNPGAKPYFEKAVDAQKMISDVYTYIGDLRTHVVNETEGLKNLKIADTLNLRRSERMDDYDMPTTVLIGSEPKTPKKGPNTASELKDKMTGLHDKLIAMLDNMQKTEGQHLLPADYEGLKKKLASIKPVDSKRKEDGVEFNWEMDNFYHLPLAAVYTNLNKFQSDLKNVEAEILQVFSGASGKLAIKFDHIVARVVAPSSYIQAGSPYEADIFLAASSSKLGQGDMEIIMGVDSVAAAAGSKGSSLVPLVNGEGKYSVGTGGQGEQTYKGVIKYKNPDGTFKYYPFGGTYMVAAPSVAVSADQMKVFYAGVMNPVSISAAGIAPTDLVVNASGAGAKYVSKGGGKYEFTFVGTGTCNISVSAKTKDGTKAQGPPVAFKVKPLPKPELKVGGKFAPQELKKGEISLVSGLGAGANGFEFQANFIVMSYEVTGKAKGKLQQASGNGNNLAADAQAILKGADVGTKVYIDAKVKGPDGKLNSVTCGIKVTK
jgi:gliding motility-associated protein GldM